jgi:hypothetical protein
MSNEDQAKADTAEDQKVDDPLDASNIPDSGTSELAAYEAEIASLEESEYLNSTEELTQGDTPAEDPDAEEDFLDDEGEGGETEEELSEEPDEESDDADEPEVENRTGRFRIRAADEVETEALSLRKRHPDWSLKDCIAKAEQILGVQPAAQEDQADDFEGSVERETVKSLTEQINDLRQQKLNAVNALEIETSVEIEAEIDKLLDRREELRIEEYQERNYQVVAQRQQYETSFEESSRKAVSFYPEAADANSALVKRIHELDAQMRELDDPIYNSPDKPFLLARAAAKQLGIIMSDPNKPRPMQSKSSKTRPVQPASGNARTSAPAPATRLEARLDEVQTLEDYEALVGSGF